MTTTPPSTSAVREPKPPSTRAAITAIATYAVAYAEWPLGYADPNVCSTSGSSGRGRSIQFLAQCAASTTRPKPPASEKISNGRRRMTSAIDPASTSASTNGNDPAAVTTFATSVSQAIRIRSTTSNAVLSSGKILPGSSRSVDAKKMNAYAAPTSTATVLVNSSPRSPGVKRCQRKRIWGHATRDTGRTNQYQPQRVK